MLTEDHERQRVEAARRFLECYAEQGKEFLYSIVTGNEIWVHYTTPETKEKSCQWQHQNSPKSQKFKQTLSASIVMASVFWDRKSVLFYEFMPTGTTINAACYSETFIKIYVVPMKIEKGECC